MTKKIFFYILSLVVFVALIWIVTKKGTEIESVSKEIPFTQSVTPVVHELPAGTSNILQILNHNIRHPLSMLLLQIMVILFISKVFGNIAVKIGQSAVIGEIVGGIFLGPSIVGHFFPEFSTYLFPSDSIKTLQFLSQIGLMFFMFVVGMEVDIEKLKHKVQNAVIISHVSIAFSFFLGVGLSYFIYENYAPLNISFVAFALFMGIATSITAFPVMARILKERNLTHTPLGVLAITCAAIDDVTAWCLLAIVIAVGKAGSMASAFYPLMLTVVFLVVMIFVVRPLLQKISSRIINKRGISKTLIAISFFVLVLSSFATEIIGIHALFGAFIAGLIMPHQSQIKNILIGKIEDVSVVLLLPVFFALTGLRTQIGLVSEGNALIILFFVVLVAVTGKLAGGTIVTRLTKHSWYESLSIGILMNTRGLMELVVLNIGYDLGILSPQIFAIMVLMALLTTFMTNPLLDLATYFHKKNNIHSGG